ncbi:MAG: F0F1 ATP synthase subunit delta [Burkholderiales bacterium]|nr:F0F1 ATP synthase subunit delta [Burkholderiales bacterium]
MNKQNVIAYPYANAAFEIAKSSNMLDKWLNDLKSLAIVANSSEFTDLINNPLLEKDMILNILCGFTSNEVADIRHLLSLLYDNDRLAALSQLYVLFEQKVECERNVAQAVIQSAFAISEADKKKLEQKLTDKFGKSITATVEINPELIGGIRVLVNDIVIDASIKGSLDKLTAQLIN